MTPEQLRAKAEEAISLKEHCGHNECSDIQYLSQNGCLATRFTEALSQAHRQVREEIHEGLRDVVNSYPYEIKGKSEVLGLMAGYFASLRSLSQPDGSGGEKETV